MTRRIALLLLTCLGGAIFSTCQQSTCELDSELIALIKSELEPWRENGISFDQMRGGSSRCTPGDVHHTCNSFLRLTIDNGTLYMNTLADRGEGMNPNMELPGQLLEIYETSLQYRLPNVDFTIFYSDQISDSAPQNKLKEPLFAPWKSDRHPACIPVPNSGSYRCASDGFDVMKNHLVALNKVPWPERAPIALARHQPLCPHWARDTKFPDGKQIPCPRETLDSLSEEHPDLLNSSSKHGIPMMNQTHFRYLVSTDGWSCTNKLDKYLLMGSTVIKQEGRMYGWYYRALKPWKHYVPIFINASNDILEVITWLRKNDNQAKEISDAGKNFALKVLSRSSRLCYWKTLLEHYAKLLRYKASCKLHQMCVPAIKELNYLGHYEPGWPNDCKIHKQLDHMIGSKVDHGVKYNQAYGGPNTTFGFNQSFYHDLNRTLDPDEIIQDWAPPW